MDNKQDLQIWQNRWKALDKTMQALADRYRSSEFPRHETCYHLVARLRAFSKRQFYFFLYGFNHQAVDDGSLRVPYGVPTFKLAESEVFQPEYIYRATLDQITHDLEVIQRAASGRMSGSSETIRDTLDLADKLALRCLEPAIHAGLVRPETTVLTYFQKSASIRIIPYAPVAMIGIPFTSVRFPLSDGLGTVPIEYNFVARDLLATPHEVGHYVFRHGKYKGESVYTVLDARMMGRKTELTDYGSQRVLDNWNVVEKWAEEIFADVYGCISGGPATVASSQDLALQYYSKAEFVKDDGDHPAPILRPRIYLKVLKRKEKGQNEELVRELLNRWKGHVQGRKTILQGDNGVSQGRKVSAPIEGVLTHSSRAKASDAIEVSTFISVESDKADGLEIDDNFPVDYVISEVLKILDIDASAEDQDLAGSLYVNFRDNLDRFPRELVLGELNELWEKWIREEEFFSIAGDQPLTTIDQPIKEGDLESEPDNTWVHIALAAGWSTKIGNHEGG